MRPMKLDGPQVLGEKLYGAREGVLLVGSADWYAWLDGEGQRVFFFSDAAGEWYRARREWRGECAYWYVASRVGGRVQRFYLGGVRTVDGPRLALMAATIAAARAAA